MTKENKINVKKIKNKKNKMLVINKNKIKTIKKELK